MKISVSVIAADLINDYIDGRWDRIDALHQKQHSSAINRDIPSVLDLLACLSPGRVLADGTPTSPGETAGLALSQQVLISICRGQLLHALASLSMGDTAQAKASSTAFCASLSSLLDDATPELTSPRVVLRLVGPAKLCRSCVTHLLVTWDTANEAASRAVSFLRVAAHSASLCCSSAIITSSVFTAKLGSGFV